MDLKICNIPDKMEYGVIYPATGETTEKRSVVIDGKPAVEYRCYNKYGELRFITYGFETKNEPTERMNSINLSDYEEMPF